MTKRENAGVELKPKLICAVNGTFRVGKMSGICGKIKCGSNECGAEAGTCDQQRERPTECAGD